MNLKPVVVQDANTREVLMLAYANDEALQKTKETGYAWYWSRSRNKLWMKGETSGNVQKIVGVRDDCDNDALLYLVEQKGVACHTGRYSCFGDSWTWGLGDLEALIEQRKLEKPAGSYTVKLLENKTFLLGKVLEELGEFLQDFSVEEAADFVYHFMVLLKAKGIKLSGVIKELEKRKCPHAPKQKKRAESA